MKRWLGVLGLGLVLAGPASAEDDEVGDIGFGSRRVPLQEVPDAPADASLEVPAEWKGRELPPAAYRGAEALGMDPAFVHAVHGGLELLYERKYKEARAHFDGVEAKYPGTALSAVSATLVWQSLMLENFDFRYEKQYEVSSKRARDELTAAAAVPGNDAWEQFLLAGMIGIDSIHSVRREKYVHALQLAFTAMDHVAKSKAAAPNFTDLLLADGMYNYWRTIVTQMSKALPDFGDHRVDGIAQMQAVERNGIFLGAPATLALVFTWIEEREVKRAIAGGLKNQALYPMNVINNLMLGQTYTIARKYPQALESYAQVLAADPDNARVRYYRGVVLLRTGKSDDAREEFEAYLRYAYLEDYQRAAAHFRLGQLEYRRKEYAAAEERYREAVKVNGYKPAKAALDRMKQAKKDGKITY